MNILRRKAASSFKVAATVIAFHLVSVAAVNAETLNIQTATIADINKALATGKLSSEKLVAAYLARIEAYEKKGPAINSIIYLNPEAVAQAKALDAERKAGKLRGPLHGIPVVLKDNFDTFDMATTGGSQLLEGSIPPDDAFTVKKLRDAGAIILAKLNLHVWAGGGGSVSGATDPEILKAGAVPNGSSTAGGQTLNPHDLARGPAGSSGGTGAAIAAVFAPLGMATDTGGSVRGPAAANGHTGLKVTFERVPKNGVVPLGYSLDSIGPMARSALDCALLLQVMVWAFWCSRGRYALVVYSNSPIWQAYFEQHVLPAVGRRGVVLNWSERKRWPFSLPVALFRVFGGTREFNPLAIVFQPPAWPRRFRFYGPFQAFKHGRPQEVEELRRDLLELLDGLAPETAAQVDR